MKPYSRRVIDYNDYYYDIDSDRFQCKKCNYHCGAEDEMIRHCKDDHIQSI